MPSSKPSNPFLKMQHVDLAYAVHSLVRLGTTTANQVRALAAERKSKLARLTAELAALEAGTYVEAPPAPAKRQYTRQAAKVSVQSPAKRKVGRPKGSEKKAMAKVAKPAKRAGDASLKIKAIQKLQGRYMGIRRHLSHTLQVQATKIAHTEGVAAALKFVEAKRVTPAKAVVKKVKMSPTMRAARKVQGRYLGLRRWLTADLRTQATKVAQSDGVVAALKFVEANQPAARA
jgi:hypothetical protein